MNTTMNSMIKIQDIAHAIFSVEEELDLFNKTIKGVYFWNLIRFPVYRKLSRQTGLYDQAHSSHDVNSRTAKIKHVLQGAKNLFSKNPYFNRKCDLLFFGHPRRKKMQDGLWWDLYCDPILKKISHRYNCILLEKPRYPNHCTPPKTPRISYLDLPALLGTVYFKLRKMDMSLSPTEERLLCKIEDCIARELGVAEKDLNLRKLNLRQVALGAIATRAKMLPIYTHLLAKLEPKLVIMVVSYTNQIFVEACKSLNIPVAELQHGFISKYHLGYYYPRAKPLNNALPDYFFAFGDYWIPFVDSIFHRENIFSVGYPFFEMETEKHLPEDIRGNIRRDIRRDTQGDTQGDRGGRSNKKQDQVVFISQGTTGREMSRFAVSLAARGDFPLQVIYKLHPGEYSRWKKAYPWLIDSGVEVIQDDSTSLYKLLAEAKALVGLSSTVIYEGLGLKQILGLDQRVFLLDLPGIENMNGLIETGAACKISTVDELVKKLMNPSPRVFKSDTKEDFKEQNINTNCFFQPHSLQNISQGIDEIIMKP